LPSAYSVTGGGAYCAGGSGVAVGLNSSDFGVNYQLYNGSVPVGGALAGNNAALSFGMQTVAGTYSVMATNTSTTCSTLMTGTAMVTINALPLVHAVAGGGSYCAGAGGLHVALSASDNSAKYQLYNGATAVGGMVTGTGGAIDFGLQATAGTYTVLATNIANSCTNAMSGSAPINVNPLPSVYAVTGGGGYCSGGSGVHVGLIGSATGINYRLYNGTSPVGASQPGTGSPLDFGFQSAAGTYTVLATNSSTACTQNMIGAATVSVNPLPAVNNVTGGGSYCAGGTGINIGLDGSENGVNYLLYNGSSYTATVAGSGAAIDFGLEGITGTYTVNAINTTTGCQKNMAGGASGSTTPTVNPTVAVSSGAGDTICAGTFVVFTASGSNGGSSPVYQWSVNGTNVGFAIGSYSYFPADGDVVKVSLTSSIACAVPTVVSNSLTMTVHATQTPVVTASVSPGDTICGGGMATFTAMPAFGGATPSYTWIKNNASVGTGVTYSYTPVNGDVVYCKMISDYTCRTVTAVSSNTVTMTIGDPVSPSVGIVADPGTSIAPGQEVVLTANVLNAGVSPSFQWFVNGVAAPGATSSVFSGANFANGDSVTCQVTKHTACGNLVSFNTITMTVSNVGVVSVGSSDIDVRIMPNPNNGEFTIKGSIGSEADQEVSVEITDMLSQVIVRSKAAVRNGAINEHITMNRTIANGMYMLNIQTATSHKTFQVVVRN